MSEARQDVVVRNRNGLHARPASEFVKLASGFEAQVKVRKDDLEVNGKSIMGVLMLAAEPGAELTVTASGEDADDAVEALAEFLRSVEDEPDDEGEEELE